MTATATDRRQLKTDLEAAYRVLSNLARLLKSTGETDTTGVALATAAAILKARVQVEQGIAKLGGGQ